MSERPAEQGVVGPPRWPWFFAPTGLVGALIAVLTIAGVLAVAVGIDTAEPPSEFTLAATLIQDAVLIGVALALARTVARPRPWHFGLRRVSFRSALGWTVLALVSFYVLTALYSVVVQPDGEQTVVEDLGADEGTLQLIAAAILVVIIAPFVEEFFFRGFIYGALRSRLSVWVAATINGLIFGAIHYSGPDTLSILPPLALLGFLFCLLYERTGSLYPVIAFHAFNNAVALAVATGSDGALASAAAGALALGACVLVPRRQSPGAPHPLLHPRTVEP